jgi:hypothetical protein
MVGTHSSGVPSASLLALSVFLATALAVLLPVEELRAEDPKIAYWLHCGGCHRLDGVGAPPDVPTLIEAPGHIEALPGGRDYLIRIPGVAQAGLDDSRLAEVLNYMLYTFSSSSLAIDFKPYSGVEISRHRHRVLKDPLKRRLEILTAAGGR